MPGEWDLANVSVTKLRSNAPAGWNATDDVTVELRYRLGQRKYRALLRSDDDVDGVVARMRVCMERGVHVGVRRAALIDHNHHEGEDVTARVSKYMGPNMDCHGLDTVRVRDLFPRDDHKFNAMNCGLLRVMYANGEHAVFRYDSDTHIGTKKVPWFKWLGLTR